MVIFKVVVKTRKVNAIRIMFSNVLSSPPSPPPALSPPARSMHVFVESGEPALLEEILTDNASQ